MIDVIDQIQQYKAILIQLLLLLLSLYIGITIGRYIEHNKKDNDNRTLSYRNLIEKKIKLKSKDISSSSLSSAASSSSLLPSSSSSLISLDTLLVSNDNDNNNSNSINTTTTNTIGLSFAPSCYTIEINTAKSNLCRLLDIDTNTINTNNNTTTSSSSSMYTNKQWTLVRTANNVNVWTSKSKDDGILIRGINPYPNPYPLS